MRSHTTRWPASSTTAIATLNPSACALAKPRSTLSRARARVSAMSGGLDPDLAGFDRLRLTLLGRAVPLDDLIAPLAVDFVRLDVDREELHFVVREAVVRLERRQVPLVDAGHLRLEPDEQARGRDVERLVRHLE